jgi:class 3 adenylate cyclase
MGNPYGIALNSAWTAWATECALGVRLLPLAARTPAELRAIAPSAAGLPPERRIELRVGIHLGDVVEESDGDLMGDGVNIAARLEGIAKPGAICLSEDAYRQANVVAAEHAAPVQRGGLVRPDAQSTTLKAINPSQFYEIITICYPVLCPLQLP